MGKGLKFKERRLFVPKASERRTEKELGFQVVLKGLKCKGTLHYICPPIHFTTNGHNLQLLNYYLYYILMVGVEGNDASIKVFNDKGEPDTNFV